MGPDNLHVQPGQVAPKGSRVLRIESTSDDTAQTRGMIRKVAISRDDISNQLWFGRVTCPPGLNSGPHHHGAAETAGYMLSGERIRIYFGENFETFVDIEPGDCLYVPPWLPHIEVNLSADTPGEFVTARVPDNIVLNLEDNSVIDDIGTSQDAGGSL